MKKPIRMLLFLRVAVFLFPQSPSLPPQSPFLLQALLGNEIAAQLLAEGKLTQSGGANAALTPQYAPLLSRIEQTAAAVRPNVITESLYLYVKPGPSGALPFGAGNAWTEEERAAVYNETLALSTLAGIEYYSRRRGRMRVLYETSHVVDETDTRQPLPDPVYQTPPAKLSLYARQKDMTFGDNVYLFTYETDERAFIITQENVSTITLAFVPVVGKRNLRSVVALLDAGEYLLLYSVSLARTVILPGMKDQMYTSIGNRTAAYLAWFSRRADIAYAKTGSANRPSGELPEKEAAER